MEQEQEQDVIEDLRKSIVELEYQYDILKESVQNKTIELYDEDARCYTVEAQKCCLSLLGEGVASHRVCRSCHRGSP